MTTQPDDAAKAVRTYLAELARRYLGAVAFFTALALVIAFVPTVSRSTSDTAQPGAFDSAESVPGSGAGFGPGATGKSKASSFGSGKAGSGPAASSMTSASGEKITPPKPPGSAGVTRGGVRCGEGIRQVPWSAYAPICIPRWSGNNGGATARGVTKKTITITFRKSNTAQDSALKSIAGDTWISDDDYIADLQNLIPLFNRTFELYGRRVVLKPFQGEGNWLQEYQGQNQQGAQADAATARKMGAFADDSHLVYMTPPYAQSLAQEGVISLNTLSFTQAFYERYSPYMYSYTPTADKLAGWYTNVICNRLHGRKATFAGNPIYKRTKRVFGLTVLDTPNYIEVGNFMQRWMKEQCGAEFVERVNYALDPVSEQRQAPSIIARMKAAGVTTFVCYCSYSMLQYLTHHANQQDYHPEWVVDAGGDMSGRLPAQNQWAHAIGYNDHYFMTSGIVRERSEAYRAYELGSGGKEPRSQYFAMAYYGLLHFFSGLQQAGPNLTPETFQRGMFSLPTSELGDAGTWSFGRGAFTPGVNTQVTRWKPNRRSGHDGRQGSWVPCDRGRFYSFFDPKAWGGRRSLDCP